MLPVLFHVGPFAVPTHDFFVGLGVLVAFVLFWREAYGRDRVQFETFAVVTGALFGGAVGMRLSGWARHLDLAANPTLAEAWTIGTRSVLGGLLGAYVGVLVAKRLVGYREPTGDLFAPAVALGMAVGRIGCLLTEPPGRPTSLPWGVHAPAGLVGCPGCAEGVPMHPSFAYEIAFQLAMFVVLLWLRPRLTHRLPGEMFTIYVAAYAVFRFAVEFTRANEPVWLDLTRPQWFLLPGIALLFWRFVRRFRQGVYDPFLRGDRASVEAAR